MIRLSSSSVHRSVRRSVEWRLVGDLALESSSGEAPINALRPRLETPQLGLHRRGILSDFETQVTPKVVARPRSREKLERR